MTKRPKIRSSRVLFLLALSLLIILCCFFVFATFFFFHFNAFPFLAFAVGFCLIPFSLNYLKLVNKTAEIALKAQDLQEKINLMEIQISDEKGMIEALREKISGYSRLKDFTEELSMSFSLHEVTKILFAEVSELFKGEDLSVILFLFQSRTGELGVAYSQTRALEEPMIEQQGDLYDQWVLRQMKPLVIEDITRDFRFDVSKISNENTRAIRSLMSVPLITGHKAVGILRMDSLKENTFKVEDLRVLTALGDLAAVAIENAQMYERVEYLATHDSLTNLYLRRHFMEMLEQQIASGAFKNQELAFLLIDLDHFKRYNDLFGHTAGDQVLKEVGALLKEMFYFPGDLICRYGGEEFLVFLCNRSRDVLLEQAEQLRQGIEQKSFTLRRKKMNITASIGAVLSPAEGKTLSRLVEDVDGAMYKAKKKGRNRVVCAS